MTADEKHYLAYMLRLWQVDDAEEPAWRASLESPHTGERRGFTDLSALFAFLQERTGSSRARSTPASSASRTPENRRASHGRQGRVRQNGEFIDRRE